MWPNSPETQHLLERVQQGEPAAVDRLLEIHREPLRRMIGLRLDPALAGRVDASDIVQDVMLEVSQRLADYLRNPVMPFHLWVRHIATRPHDRCPPAPSPGSAAQPGSRAVDRARRAGRPVVAGTGGAVPR